MTSCGCCSLLTRRTTGVHQPAIQSECPSTPARNGFRQSEAQPSLSRSKKEISPLNENQILPDISNLPPHEKRHQNYPLRFTFQDLKAATGNFRQDSILGEGGFGFVYKGWIQERGTAPAKCGLGLTVAVKSLKPNGLQGHREWLAEINFLGQLQHPNLVKLIGYCIEDDRRLLVYEFMARGSLENHLFRKAMPLSWNTRIRIALGAAEGLAFLHNGPEPVIYRDFKTSNILLDAKYNAKLSDFGLAKAGPQGDDTHVSTRVVGTHGYAAPEYILTGHLTAKNDVYGFGVVLLELLTGRRALDKRRPVGFQNLVTWARPYLADKQKIFQVIDTRLEKSYSRKGVLVVSKLATHCLSNDPKARPAMLKVIQVLRTIHDPESPS